MPLDEEISKAVKRIKKALGRGARSVEPIVHRIGEHDAREARRQEEHTKKNAPLPPPKKRQLPPQSLKSLR